jgi:sulfatase modifying factor 1
MAWVAPGETTLGSDHFQPEERPRRTAFVEGFWIDRTEVTNEAFGMFVRATGYKTVAEREGAGGAVFAPETTTGGGWALSPTASWRDPFGDGKGIAGRGLEPVVLLAHEDAMAYAQWLGRDLPTEAEWERAARAGGDSEYVWGDEPAPGGRRLANHWQGPFPAADTGDDGYAGLAPVGCFPANGLGLFDMTGNVWEWTGDLWPEAAAIPGWVPGARVIKGGSWMCADNYCHRYRPAARQPGDASLGSVHIGFRTVLRAPGPQA